MPFRCRFAILSDTRYLALLRQWISSVQHIVGDANFPNAAISVCSLALIECVDNAIFHAHKGNKNMPIGVSISVGGGWITMNVTDMGDGFVPSFDEEPDFLSTSGRGLFIIKKLMTSADVLQKDGFNTIRMKYRI